MSDTMDSIKLFVEYDEVNLWKKFGANTGNGMAVIIFSMLQFCRWHKGVSCMGVMHNKLAAILDMPAKFEFLRMKKA